MVRKKGPVWEHFQIISKGDNPHPHVRCKYCSKEFKRAIPERMRDHLNKKKCQPPNITSSRPIQQNTISINDNSNDRLSEGEQKSNEPFLAKELSSSSNLRNSEEVKMQIDDNNDSSLSGIRHLGN
ncbi:unnamed protein product [Rhizophagus irregularis]|nr:unnamed protein product [Rhizophagus irregularis]